MSLIRVLYNSKQNIVNYKKEVIMPRVQEMKKILKGHGITGSDLARMLGCSHPTAKDKLEHTEKLTLLDLSNIAKCGIISLTELREGVEIIEQDEE